MTLKRRLAQWLRRYRLLRFPARQLGKIVAPRQTVSVAGMIFNDHGQVLVAEHLQSFAPSTKRFFVPLV